MGSCKSKEREFNPPPIRRDPEVQPPRAEVLLDRLPRVVQEENEILHFGFNENSICYPSDFTDKFSRNPNLVIIQSEFEEYTKKLFERNIFESTIRRKINFLNAFSKYLTFNVCYLSLLDIWSKLSSERNPGGFNEIKLLRGGGKESIHRFASQDIVELTELLLRKMNNEEALKNKSLIVLQRLSDIKEACESYKATLPIILQNEEKTREEEAAEKRRIEEQKLAFISKIITPSKV